MTLTREWEARFEDLKRSMEASVEDRYDSGVKRILEQNRRMVAELKLHSEVSAESEARARPSRRRTAACAASSTCDARWRACSPSGA